MKKYYFLTATGGYLVNNYFKKIKNEAEGPFPYFSTAYRYSPKFEKRYKNGEDSNLITED